MTGERNFIICCMVVVFVVLVSSCGPRVEDSKSWYDPNEMFKNLTQVTFSDTADYHPDISRDGKMMLFVSETDSHLNTHIYLKKDMRSRQVIQKTSFNSQEMHPVFSPDGKEFAFSSNNNGNFDIYIMSVDKGQSIRQVTDGAGNKYSPNWHPDGKRIAYSQLNNDGEYYIRIMDLETRSPTVVNRGLIPKFSPDGKRILYKKAGSEIVDKLRFYQLWVMDIDGGNDTRLTYDDKSGVRTFCWCPDGKFVMYSTTTKDPELLNENDRKKTKFREGADLWAQDLDGINIIHVTTHKGDDYDPCWVYNGDLYFTSDRTGKTNIWMCSTDICKAPPPQPYFTKPQQITEQNQFQSNQGRRSTAESRPSGVYSGSRFIDHNNGTITDTETGLMWAKVDSYTSTGRCLDFYEARKYVETINTGSYYDWKLPTISDLRSIYDSNSYSSIKLVGIFSSPGTNFFWSSEAFEECCAAVFDYSSGNTRRANKTDCSQLAVRPVRYAR